MKRKHIIISKEMHDKVRYEAFHRRISMKKVVETALQNFYNWKNPKEEQDEEEVKDPRQ